VPKPTLTIALDRYDRHVPFFMGLVPRDAPVDVVPLEVGMVSGRRDGANRHGRMLHDREFDVCEVSLSSYIIAKSRGAPFTAVPVFPRRLFSQGNMFVAKDSAIEHPRELAGRRVGVWSFQTTLSVLAKGDLALEYGTPWQSIEWHTLFAEEIRVEIPEATIRRLPEHADVVAMLARGELDALVHPHPPADALLRDGPVRRLFRDWRGEAVRYFGKYGHYPIMHLLVLTEALAEREPWLPRALIEWWEQSKTIARDFYHDPTYALMPFAQVELADQEAALGADLFPSGLALNRPDLDQFLDYSFRQHLTTRRLGAEELFHGSVLNT
jgi:4,5-dihydroxyphthalate decarboxylase